MSSKLRVRRATHARIGFDVSATRHSELVIDYLRKNRLLARETRPLSLGARHIDIKTHPAASHLVCTLKVAGKPVANTRFDVECGADVVPVGRQFIVIGAMKAGTTTLFEMLAKHPALCRTWVEVPGRSYTKEINYFRQLYRKSHTPVNYDWRFPFAANRHAWTLDASPNYAKLPESKAVAARIAALGGATKLAYILRDPVDRIESQVAHALREGKEIRNFNHCIRVSRYARHLDHFTKHIPREDILLLDFNQLRASPESVLAQVCKFLSIEPFVTGAQVHNKRSVKFRLTPEQRTELTHAVRPDVQHLISDYGFEPAKYWLNGTKRNWIKLPSR